MTKQKTATGDTGGTSEKRSRYPLATKEKFIGLRAGGLSSFAKIAEKLKVSKPTLLQWNGELQAEIATARSVELEAMRERYFLNTERRLELFGGEVERMREELTRRDYSDVPTGRLLDMLLRTHEALAGEDVKPVFKTEEERKREQERQDFLLKLSDPLTLA